MNLTPNINEQSDPISRCVVKLITSAWSTKNGLYLKKSLTFLRRQCSGFNILEEDLSSIGADDVITNIINLNECDDGVYEVVMCNKSYDIESGYVDCYDYKLVAIDN